jgi:hypothetical protein
MTNKRIRLPKEGLVEPEHGHVGPGEHLIDQTDVEGHGWTHPAPPIDFSPRSPSTGGELTPDSDSDNTGNA